MSSPRTAAARRISALTVLLAGLAAAQNERALPSFEAASVKPLKPGGAARRPLHGGPETNSPGQLTGAATLKALLMRAYDLKGYQIAGPGWMDSERYEIAAKIPAGATREQVALMLQSLLTERFGMALHRTTKELPVYALLPAKGGPKLKEVTGSEEAADAVATPKLVKGPDGLPEIPAGSEVPRSYEIVMAGSDGILYKLWARHETMQQLADRLSSQLNRAVVDMTGLKGRYDFTLTWTVDSAGGGVPRTSPPPDQIESHPAPILADPGLSIFAALPRQIGLRLQSRRVGIGMLVIDKVERTPSGN